MKIFFGSDHAGYRLKETLKRYVSALGHTPIDVGPFRLDPKDDYPDYIVPAVRAAVKSKSFAIAIGGSGLGECMAANKVPGARAASCFDAYTAKMARRDNDANVLCLGARTSAGKSPLAKKIVKIWLATPFSGAARHKRRLTKISRIG